MLFEVNFLAVIVATLAGFMFGWGWYSLFSKTWTAENGIDPKEMCKDKAHSRRVYISALLLSFLSALALAVFLTENATASSGALFGFIIGTFWVTASLGVNYLFANRSYKLFLIDGGYHIGQFIIYGIILGAWH